MSPFFPFEFYFAILFQGCTYSCHFSVIFVLCFIKMFAVLNKKLLIAEANGVFVSTALQRCNIPAADSRHTAYCFVC